MPPVSPTDLVALALLAAAVVLVPSALAFALFSLARKDPPAADRPAVPSRRSPRRSAAADRTRHSPRHRPGPSGPRRFGGR